MRVAIGRQPIQVKIGTVAISTGGGIGDAPNDGKQYVRKDGGWIEPVISTGRTVYLASLGAGVDNAAAINAALNDAAVSEVQLLAGVFGISSAVIVPTGKVLRGAGRGQTTLKVLIPFNTGTANNFNCVVGGAISATDFIISDMLLDGSKRGLTELLLNDLTKRVSGCKTQKSDRYLIERVDTKDTTGYAHHDQGAYGATPQYCSRATRRDCKTINANVHFEQTCSQDINIIDFVCEDGDGDIPCECYISPLEGSRRIRFTNGKITRTAGVAVGLAIAKGAATYGCADIVVENVVSITNGIGIVAGGTVGAPILRLRLVNCSFTSTANIGTNLGYTNGYIVGCAFAGDTIGFQSDAGCKFLVTDCYSTGTNNGVGAAAYGVNIVDTATQWNGGTITAIAPSGSPIAFSGTFLIGPTTRTIPSNVLNESIRQSVSGAARDIYGHVTGASYSWLDLPTAPLDPAKVKGGGVIAFTGSADPSVAVTDVVAGCRYDSATGRLYFFINGQQAANAGWKLRCWAQEWV